MGVLDGLETTLKNCRLYYQWHRKEEADAPTVLLLHGWGCDSSIFSFIENGLFEGASVLSVDFPGHGKSAHFAGALGSTRLCRADRPAAG